MLLALGILTALIGYTMDWCIMKIQRLRMIAVESVDGDVAGQCENITAQRSTMNLRERERESERERERGH